MASARPASAAALVFFILLFALISISSFLQKSPTFDEIPHLFAGYSYLKWGDFRANPEHPPLAKVWAALPLLALDIRDPRPARPHWNLILEDESFQGGPTIAAARDMIFVDNDAETLFFFAKLQMVALGILLGLFVYRWSKELFGLEAAIVSLFMYGLDPNILAHSQIVHNDIPFTAFFFIGTYFFWRALERLTVLNLLLTAAFFALATITKYSYPLVVIVWTVLGFFKVFSATPQQCSIGATPTVSNRLGKSAVLGVIFLSAFLAAYLFTWAAYGFRFNAVADGEMPLSVLQVLPENSMARTAASFLVQHRLLPEASIYGQLHLQKYFSRPAYLLGETSDNGFLSYFPIAFAVKTPLPTLLLFLTGIVAMWLFRKDRAAKLFLILPALVYFSFAVWSRMNIGLRYILPIYPFLFVFAGGAAVELWRCQARARKGLVLLGVWFFWSSMSSYPHYLSFFNELAGGAKNGHRVLIDSNLDWGQDLKGLKRWMESQGVKKIQFLYFGLAYPEYYGIDAAYPPGSWVSYDPPATQTAEVPNYIVISADLLYGTDIHVLEPEKQKEFVRKFRTKTPVAVIGHSLYVYRLN